MILHMLQQLQPIPIRKADVRDHQIKGPLFEKLQGFLGVSASWRE
jgi:hypothetical protein